MHHVAQTTFDFKTDPPSALDVFKERAATIVERLSNHLLADKPTVVDGLWRYAVDHGLVDQLGADRVQAILAEAFK